ncbi:hypothetical protein AB0H12_43855 [Actinosynnema sp. NPDC023794]
MNGTIETRKAADAAVRRLRAHNSEVWVTGERLSADVPGALRRLAARCDVLLMAADVPQEISEVPTCIWVPVGLAG